MIGYPATRRLQMSTATTDRIEKQILLRAPRARVWRALTTPSELGAWFGVAFDDAVAFAPGARVQGQITHRGYEHLTWVVTIEQLEPEQRFSWRWHPGAIEPDHDYSSEPTTLVAFELEDVDGGTMLTITESGFDGIPLARRAEAYRGNEDGWAQQLIAISNHVASTA
jgi:uncharacterized protein YndB with AHSA1/START domain